MKTRYSPSTGTFYPLDIDYPNLPVDCIEVSIDDYNAAMARPSGHTFDFVDGQLVISAPPAPTLDQLKSAKLAELATAFAKNIDAIHAGYPDAEVKSWFKQESEAVAYTANNATPTPLLSGIASTRGITVADLAARVIANAAAYAAAGGVIIGKWQKYGDAVAAATDEATVSAISWV